MLDDFQPAPNIGTCPDLYELENRALDPDGLVLAAMRALAPWRGKTLVDLGCGTGYWLPAVNAAQGRAEVTDSWWADQGAERVEVLSSWQFDSRADLEAALRLEFPAPVADQWLAGNPEKRGLAYGYVLFAVRKHRA